MRTMEGLFCFCEREKNMTEKDLIVATNQEQRQTVEDASDEKTEISVKPAKNFEEQIEILRTRKLL